MTTTSQPRKQIQTPRRCRSCGAPVLWQKTVAGCWMPLNPPVLTVVDDAGAVHQGRISHFASCPNANGHRAKGVRR